MSNQNNYVSEIENFVDFLKNYLSKSINKRAKLLELSDYLRGSPYSYFLRKYYRIDNRCLVKKLLIFLLKFPEKFLVLNDDEVELITDKNYKLKDTIEVRSKQFISISLNLNPDHMISLREIFALFEYASTDVQEYLNNYDDFINFVNKHDKTFYIDGRHICLKSLKDKLDAKNFKIRKLCQTDLNSKLSDKIIFIHNIKIGLRIKDHILKNVKVISIDSEGTSLGSLNGSISLIQVAFFEYKNDLTLYNQNVYLKDINIYFFDILRCPELVEICLKPILLNSQITKVFHDHRGDLSALNNLCGIEVINNVFDTYLNFKKLTNSENLGLYSIFDEMTESCTENLKKRMRSYYCLKPNIWDERPLTEFLRFYAAMDVFSILTIYNLLLNKYGITEINKVILEEIGLPKKKKKFNVLELKNINLSY